jgi:hypothetical protein
MQRWDRPHWVLAPDDPLPTVALAAALFAGRAPARNLATRSVRRGAPRSTVGDVH